MHTNCCNIKDKTDNNNSSNIQLSFAIVDSERSVYLILYKRQFSIYNTNISTKQNNDNKELRIQMLTLVICLRFTQVIFSYF